MESTSNVVAIIPAHDAIDTIEQTVKSVASMSNVNEVVVVDDGSRDGTAMTAERSGARVVCLPHNIGKGGALKAGIEATPLADFYLFIDADTGATSTNSAPLLDAVMKGECDLSVGVLPSAEGKGGFGLVTSFARWVLKRKTGTEFRAPLSGQRALSSILGRKLSFGRRYGTEVEMSISASDQGATIREYDVNMDHHHRGRTFQGFGHRLVQGVDIAITAWPHLLRPLRKHR
jgi:glycosyltransferase involved in cell wall biosynthesis